jgi:hypothetical protein
MLSTEFISVMVGCNFMVGAELQIPLSSGCAQPLAKRRANSAQPLAKRHLLQGSPVDIAALNTIEFVIQ